MALTPALRKRLARGEVTMFDILKEGQTVLDNWL